MSAARTFCRRTHRAERVVPQIRQVLLVVRDLAVDAGSVPLVRLTGKLLLRCRRRTSRPDDYRSQQKQ